MSISIKKKYNIPEEAKVLLYVGNISKNKNQLQMVRAFGLMPVALRKQTYVLFCGANYLINSELEIAMTVVNDSNHLIFCGSVAKIDMPDYYKDADGVVLLSYSEGFGLSLIEGMHFGLPCAMPIDLDAFEDIYDACAVQPIRDRDDKTVADALQELIVKDWSRDAIVCYSDKFSSDTMARNYIKSYLQ